MANKIFINYRRAINLDQAQFLRTVLEKHFGRKGVFLDVRGLDGGVNWLHSLEDQVDSSTAMVSLICEDWAHLKDDKGNKRLENLDDFVRFEIARALSRKIPVLPVLVNGAEMPDISDLPTNLRPLTFTHAMKLRADEFEEDAEKIAVRLKELIAEQRLRGVSWWRAIGMSLVVGAVAAVASHFLWPAEKEIVGDPELARRIKTLETEKETFQSSYNKAARTIEDQKSTISGLKRQLTAAVKDKSKAETALSEARKTSNKSVAALQGELKQAKQRISALSQELVSEQDKLKQALADKDNAIKELAKLKGKKPPEPNPTNKPFKDCDECPSMVVVPGGTFTMGSAEGKGDKDERPAHKVTIQSFAVGRFEVTFDEWGACIKGGGCNGYKPKDEGWGRGNRPVINVSWDDAKAYVKWLREKTGKQYRLLTEAEWEYATRAGKDTEFWWGNEISRRQANYDGNYTFGNGAKGEYRKQTVPVDSFKPNPFGLYNVHGNVREWVEDCWHDSYINAPKDGSAWLEANGGNCGRRVLRGGSWYYIPHRLRARYRIRNNRDYRIRYAGFRVARTR